jgi:Fe-S oxidoreductase
LEIDAARTTCSYCPKLDRHVCPAAIAERSEVATPTFKQQVAKLVAAGALPLDQEAARVLYKCTGCLASKAVCRHSVDVEVSLRDGRGLAVRAGTAPPEVFEVKARFEARGSPFDQDLRAKVPAIASERRASVGVAFVPACAAVVDGDAALAGARAGLAVGRPKDSVEVVLPDPPCCGYPLDALGLADDFALHARRVAASLAGFSRIVVGGAGCAWTMAVRYAQVGAPIAGEVVPLAKALGASTDAVRAARRKEPDGGPFAYHDACYLGRHLGVYDEPREALAAATGSKPVELDPSRELGLCSGGGGGYPLTHPGPAHDVAARLIEAFKRSGAKTLVTACPTTKRLLKKVDPAFAVLLLEEVFGLALASKS